MFLLGSIAVQVALAIVAFSWFILKPQDMPESLLIALFFSIYAFVATLELINELIRWRARRRECESGWKDDSKTPENVGTKTTVIPATDAHNILPSGE